MNIKNKIKENKLDIIIWACYTIFILFITLVFHEKWRDEAQAWMIARDLNFFDMLKQMSYEGHPPLWHIILMPFAKLGFPYVTVSIISCMIMSITAWLVLKKSPFKKSTQILLLLTAPVIYLCPSIARSYCLIPLALALIAIFYKDRRQKKLQYVLSILLLAYSHVIMLGIAGMLYLFYFVEEIFYTRKEKKETKTLIIGLAIAVMGLVFLAILLLGSVGINDTVNCKWENIFNINRIKQVIYDIYSSMFGYISYSVGFRIVFTIFIVILTIVEYKKKPENILIAVVGILWQMFIYLSIWGISSQKGNTILLIGIFIAWIGKEKEIVSIKLQKILEFGCIMIIVLSIMQGITLIDFEINKQYSASQEAAQYINKNLEDDAIIVCTDGPLASAIIPYTDNIKFWNPSSEQYFTFMKWDEISNRRLSIEKIIEKVKKNFNAKQNIYLLNCHNQKIENGTSIEEIQSEGIISETLYKSNKDKCLKEEVYDIYKIILNEYEGEMYEN